MENILDRLKRGDRIVSDGAFGTMLMQRGLEPGAPPETINLAAPRVLEEISALYLEAGAEIINTNTFGASSLRLGHFNLDGETEKINCAAVEAARRAVEGKGYVSGSVGPTARMLKPFGDTDSEEIYSSLRDQIKALISSGVDMICIETMTDVAEAELAIKAARDLNRSIPVLATVTFGKTKKGFRTLMGTDIPEAARKLKEAGADVVGSNCGNGSQDMLEIAREFTRSCRIPIMIQSNAGLPVQSGNSLVYPETPDFFFERAEEMLELGVQIIGGCCGTTPDHIRAIRRAVDAYAETS